MKEQTDRHPTMKKISPEPAKNYVAARDEPLKYPGPRPERGYVLAAGIIYPLVYDDHETGAPGSTMAGKAVTDSDGSYLYIDDLLKSRGTPPLSERYAVLGFGSNPVPGQLVSKFGDEAVVPTIFGGLADSDIIYNLMSTQGYAFADLSLDQPGVQGSVAITFLDPEQLKIMNETEANYDLAFLPKNVTLESGEEVRGGDKDVPGLFYAGRRKIWMPEGYDNPIAVAELPSDGRTATALNQPETLELAIEKFNLDEDYGISGAHQLADYVRAEAAEGRRDLIAHMQERILYDERSLDPVNSQATQVENPSQPPKVFGDN